MSREAPARFCERRRVRFPPPTLLVILVHGSRENTEALREDVAEVLAPLGLRLSPSKTQVVHMGDGFDFLGATRSRMVRASALIGGLRPMTAA